MKPFRIYEFCMGDRHEKETGNSSQNLKLRFTSTLLTLSHSPNDIKHSYYTAPSVRNLPAGS